MASGQTRTTIAEQIQRLAERIGHVEQAGRAQAALVSTGAARLDRQLPGGGLRRGWLVEWLSARPGSGSLTLALAAAREAARSGGAVVVVDRQRSFYPPAAVQWGIPLARLLVVRPASDADTSWAVDQVLRSAGVAAALCWPGRWSDHAFRRLQLAAEQSGALGLLLREERARHEPSWAQLRLLVEPLPTNLLSCATGSARAVTARRRLVRVELLRARGSTGLPVAMELDLAELRGSETRDTGHETSAGGVVSQLAAGPPARRSSGA